MAHIGVQFIWIGEFILHVLLPFKMMILIHAFDLFSVTYFFSLMITILFVSSFWGYYITRRPDDILWINYSVTFFIF